ncbi:glutaredoxin family protein [Phosphitispora fastidiosa]|uniref:glutaredoxin family protein n=1 Tax=Phosphitispora fastidiosa TaxID=2837202 RepID=UPI001E57B27D|nr:glutaredoxin family protein [Phosphitispora fastidiosa]MBU7007895.1 glutaredoxin [Phosphitispora fastidiosa]
MGVTIYTKDGCPHCQAAKEHFSRQNIDYTEINISEDKGKIDELVKVAGVRKVPVIVEGDKVTVGFNGGG